MLEVRLEDISLSINEKTFNLDGSLFYAAILRDLGNERIRIVELKYNNRREDFVIEEGERIYEFIKEQKLTKKIQVSPCPEANFPTVALSGRYKAVIHY